MVTESSGGEQRRWLRLLGVELAVFALGLALLFATGIGWFVLPPLFAAPIAAPLTFVYLAMSSDTNRSATVSLVPAAPPRDGG
jgi:hypothetical protein